MPRLDVYNIPTDLVLGVQKNDRVPHADQDRQRAEIEQILIRLRDRPGVILADEVGMGKTFVALGVAYSIAAQSRRGPVIVMVPANLVDKWVQDLKTFCELYAENRKPVLRDEVSPSEFRSRRALRYGVARHSVDLMKLLDDDTRERCHIVFLAQGAMGRKQTDKWIRLALIREALRRHGRGGAKRLIQVKKRIHRFLAGLLWAIGEQRASDWGDVLWQRLLGSDPTKWKEIYNESLRNDRNRLRDDPVPQSVIDVLRPKNRSRLRPKNRSRLDLKPLAEELAQMPLRRSAGTSKHIAAARQALIAVEVDLWKELLAATNWKSPLLVMDEAHHLKNPATSLARQLQSPESDSDLRTGDGAMAKAFDRMLFLSATPFQLGHQELVRVMERFGDVRWDKKTLGEREEFQNRLASLGKALTESQRTAIALQGCWSRLRPEEGPDGNTPDDWWQSLHQSPKESLAPRQRAIVEAFAQAQTMRAAAESQLRPWLIRHNKGDYWVDTKIERRHRSDGAAIDGNSDGTTGLEVPQNQMLPFFLAARSAVSPGQDLLGEALCSSYEAFRFTRKHRVAERDDEDDGEPAPTDTTHSAWYLAEFDMALAQCSGNAHPKLAATVQKTVDLWERGEKVLVFAFYRQTCRALRIHISEEIERRMTTLAKDHFARAGRPIENDQVETIISAIQKRYFDDAKLAGRKALDRALHKIVRRRQDDLASADVTEQDQELLVEVVRRFLRVPTTLVRCFPIHQYDTPKPHLAVRSMLDTEDDSRVSWRAKFDRFIDFLIDGCSSVERKAYLEAAKETETGRIRIGRGESVVDEAGDGDTAHALANIQEATGKTKRDQRTRLMRAFNTPFFPDILVCSQVMGEGVDLQRYCRHVIHHDLAWNPSSIEQRTGRIDRIGCKAESTDPQQSIHVYLPYLSGTADERQYRVMTDREQWFRIVMGQDDVAKLIPRDKDHERAQLPAAFSEELTFHLELSRKT